MNFDTIGSAYYGDKKKKKDETPAVTQSGGSILDRIGSAYYGGSNTPASTPEPPKKTSFLDDLLGKVTQGAHVAWDSITHKGFGGSGDSPQFKFDAKAGTGPKPDFSGTNVPSSAQMQVTQHSLDRAKKVVDALSFIPDQFSRLFPETTKAFGELDNDKLNLKADIHKAIPDFVKTIKDSWELANANQPVTKTLWQMLATATPFGQATGNALPFSNPAQAGKSLENVTRTIGVPLSLFSAVFSAANDVPLAGTLSKAITLPFIAIGEGAPKVSNKIIDLVPNNILTPEDKAALKPGVGEAFALALQLLAGKAAEVGPKKMTQLTRKFGETDAKAIVDTAQKLAHEKKQVEQMGKTEPVVVTPDSVRIQMSDLPETPATQALREFADQAEGKKKNIEVTFGGGSKEKGVFKGTTPSGVDFSLKLVDQHEAHFAPDAVLQKAFEPVTKREVVKIDKTKYQGMESGTLILRPNGTASVDVRFAKEAQGKGQGTKAVAELEQMAKDRGAQKMEIAAFTEAQGFWEKQGYSVVPGAKTKSSLLVKMDKTLVIRQPETTSGKIAGMNWYRGVDKRNAGQADKFYSASENVAGDYGKVEKINPEELPKNPLEVANKEELAPEIGYKGDPLAEALDMPIAERFDTLAKNYAQSKGYDGIMYLEGTMGEPELHRFGATVEKAPEKIPTLQEATKMLKDEGGFSKVTEKSSLPVKNRYAAEQLGDSLGLNGKFLYEEATKKGIDLLPELKRFDALRPEKGVDLVLPFANELIAKLTGEKGINADAFKGKELEFVRNPEKSPNMGSRFGQDIEPAGKYMNIKEGGHVVPGFETGKIKFDNPLVLDWGEGYQSGKNWKNLLSQKYGGKTGKELSTAIVKDGYDGIITLENGKPSEIVSLQDLTSNYLYHGTSEQLLDNITKEGLKPMRRGLLSLSKDEAYARSFAESSQFPRKEGNGVTLRVKADLLKGKTVSSSKSRPASDQLHEILTKESISPEAIEVKINGQWQPLSTLGKEPPKEVGVPRDQLPIGTGEEAISALQDRVSAALKGLSEEQIDALGVTEFNRMNNKETIAKAAEYVIKNPDEALKVLTGEIQPPEGLNSNSIFVAMANNAIGDFKLATKLATLKSTAMGQNIEILKELNVNSPVKIISDIYKVKEADFQKRFAGQSVSQVKKKFVSRAKAKMEAPKMENWNDIIKSVEC